MPQEEVRVLPEELPYEVVKCLRQWRYDTKQAAAFNHNQSYEKETIRSFRKHREAVKAFLTRATTEIYTMDMVA